MILDEKGLKQFGITITRTDKLGVAWRVTMVEKIGGNKQSVYVKCFDSQGQRASRKSVYWRSPDANATGVVPLDKPDSPMELGHGDVPMWPGNTYVLSINDSLDGDMVSGLHTNHPDDELGTRFHHGFRVTWQLSREVAKPPVEKPPVNGEVVAVLARHDKDIEYLKASIELIRRHLQGTP